MATITATLPVARTRPRRPRNQPVAGRASFPEAIFVKQIDNSALRREVDRGKRRECFVLLGLGILFFVVVFAYAWQHFTCLRNGYELESLKGQRLTLEESNRELRLERAHLNSLERIDTMARQELGLGTPTPHQVIAVGEVGSGAAHDQLARNFASSPEAGTKPAHSPAPSAEER